MREARVYTINVADRFGDNGIVGIAIVRRDGAAEELDTFLLSCRVIGRTVETAILAKIIEEARKAGTRTLNGRFIPTKKNAPAREFFPSHGFRCTQEDDSGSWWTLDLDQASVTCPEWITIESTERVAA